MDTPDTSANQPDRAGTAVISVGALRQRLIEKLLHMGGKDPVAATVEDWLHASAYVVRDQLLQRWMDTIHAHYMHDAKRVYYLSMEFLIGRSFTNAVLALDLMPILRQALAGLDVNLDSITELEPDAALGNGGLGRLAACFLDSMATLDIPAIGYGIRYEYGMFRQNIIDGRQVETPDYWLTHGNPWEFPRPEVQYRVRYGGQLETRDGRLDWIGTDDVLAMAYDTMVPGYGTRTINTLRLWRARATEEIDLDAFNDGDFTRSVERKYTSENVSRVLYPNDSTPPGRELRLRQEYFFCSASLQDLIHRYLLTHTNFDEFADKVSIHLNDTHPVLTVPELMRLLVDEHGLDWDTAWGLARRTFSYTNHTLMQEALETWPVELFGRLLPRHLRIVFDINARFLAKVTRRLGYDAELQRRVSLVDESGERRLRMAHLAVVASYSVNGVSTLHSQLMVQSIFADFARLYPERFNNKTNGITPRRWLAQANPKLAQLLDQQLGRGWRRDLRQIQGLRAVAEQPEILATVARIKRHNKQRLVAWIDQHLNITLDPDALFDVQVKRIHEYKRQLLNVLHVISRYQQMLAQPRGVDGQGWVPRVVVFAGKAASAYAMAKLIIHLINDVAAVVNADARLQGRLKVVFVPNYGVSLAELIIPAADLSEQISLAGTEASGTGNMKFALNGALTLGTLDGANIEIREQVGADNLFIFGNTAAQVQQLRAAGYQPRALYEADPRLAAALDAIGSGAFSPDEPNRYQAIHDSLLEWGDHYLLLADYADYLRAQAEVDALYRDQSAWTRKAVCNIAGMGPFSSDRSIAEYAHDIWHTQPVAMGTPAAGEI